MATKKHMNYDSDEAMTLRGSKIPKATPWQTGRGGGSTKNIGSSSKKAGRWTTPCSARMTRFTRRRDSKWQN